MVPSEMHVVAVNAYLLLICTLKMKLKIQFVQLFIKQGAQLIFFNKDNVKQTNANELRVNFSGHLGCLMV